MEQGIYQICYTKRLGHEVETRENLDLSTEEFWIVSPSQKLIEYCFNRIKSDAECLNLNTLKTLLSEMIHCRPYEFRNEKRKRFLQQLLDNSQKHKNETKRVGKNKIQNNKPNNILTERNTNIQEVSHKMQVETNTSILNQKNKNEGKDPLRQENKKETPKRK
eukprot:UN22741